MREPCPECGSEDFTHIGTDLENSPETVYEECQCVHCKTIVSDVYRHAGHQVVQPNGDEPYEIEVSD